MSIKVHYKTAIAKIFFVLFFINFKNILTISFNNNNKILECMAQFGHTQGFYYSIIKTLSYLLTINH